MMQQDKSTPLPVILDSPDLTKKRNVLVRDLRRIQNSILKQKETQFSHSGAA
jgi:hypothetical protein